MVHEEVRKVNSYKLYKMSTQRSLKFSTIGVKGNRIGCGKDTVTLMIMRALEKAGVVIRHKKFATPIREIVSILTGVPTSVTETTEGKAIFIPKAGKTIGKLLQDIGSAMKQAGHDEVWIDAAFVGIDKDNVIFSDVRFPKELQVVKERNGIVIEVRREGGPEINPLAGRSSLHESETALRGCEVDFVIENNGTVEELEEKVNAFVEQILLA